MLTKTGAARGSNGRAARINSPRAGQVEVGTEDQSRPGEPAEDRDDVQWASAADVVLGVGADGRQALAVSDSAGPTQSRRRRAFRRRCT